MTKQERLKQALLFLQKGTMKMSFGEKIIKRMEEMDREELYLKAIAEQTQFVDELLKKPPKEIVDASYEKAVRDNILILLESDELSYETVHELLKTDRPVSVCYDSWLKSDTNDIDILKNVLEARLGGENL